MRVAVLATAMCLSVIGLSLAADAEASISTKQPTNIPAQTLVQALKTLAKNRGIQVVFRSEVVGRARTHGASGDLTTTEALTKLLEGTDLAYSYLDEKTVTILPRAELESRPGTDPATTVPNTSDAQPEEGRKSFWDSFRVAQAAQVPTAKSSAIGNDVQSSSGSSGTTSQLEEVLVTAQKKSENLMDVPVPMSVLNADALADNNEVLLRDYYSSVPGLSYTPSIEGAQLLSIRGVTTGGGTIPTVRVLIDDVAYGFSTVAGIANEVPDIDPGDLARIEVLRGPQGTLYGADSLGGLIKYVTKDPSTDGFSGRVQGGTDYVDNGAEPGYSLRGSVNVPLSDTLAIRVSGFTRQDAGYIDNAALNLNGVNESESDGARISALWRPSEDLSLKLSALYQYTKTNGSNDVEPSIGDLQQNDIAGSGWVNRTVQAYSATLDYKIGDVKLTSVTAYNIMRFRDSVDLSNLFGSLAFDFFGVNGGPFIDDNKVDKITQELRLSGSLFRNLEWLVGGYYTHENCECGGFIGASNPTTGEYLGNVADLGSPNYFQEYAAFADLTYHFTDRVDIQVGGRESHYTNGTKAAISSGPLYGPLPSITPPVAATGDAFTYLITPEYKVSPDLMVYARLASGYRPGGPNDSGAISGGAPASFNPDKTSNYEIGVKGEFLDHELSVDGSLYYIDWKNIQIQLDTPQPHVFGYVSNGSAAKSEGAELSVTARPLAGLTISAWASYDDAVLTQNLPADSTVLGRVGNRLPATSAVSGDLSLQQEFILSRGTTGFIGGEANFVGNRQGVFTAPPSGERQIFPAYTKLDMRAGARTGSWTVSFYVNNVANTRGVLNGGIGYFVPDAFFYIQPRTEGVTISKTF